MKKPRKQPEPGMFDRIRDVVLLPVYAVGAMVAMAYVARTSAALAMMLGATTGAPDEE